MMFVRSFPLALLIAIPLFASAGRWQIPAFAAYVLLHWLSTGTIYTLALRRHPGLVAERLKPPSDRDRATRRIAIPLFLAFCIVAGLDVGRFGWSTVHPAVQAAGFAAVAAGLAFVGWTLLSNPYASTAVRIQEERGHEVITTGPYAIVRHPMYLGVLLFALGSGPALGSWWAGLVMLPILGVFVRRTLREDRMLHEELPGYAAYARTVRSRVVPGVF